MNKQSKRFYEIIDVIKELHDKKRHDYGANEDIFANFRLSELSGIPAWQGSVIRMGDKYARISNFIKKGDFKFKEENIKDTLNYKQKLFHFAQRSVASKGYTEAVTWSFTDSKTNTLFQI